MKKKLDDKLVNRYPIIFKDRHKSMQETCMCWGFPSDGWYNIINRLCFNITVLIEKYNIDVTAVQVKEKFGGLRFYVDISGSNATTLCWIEDNVSRFLFKYKLGVLYWKIIHIRQWFYKTAFEKVRDLINDAEFKSYTTCEICGKSGKARGNGWIQTLCDDCNKEK